jgi:hypothetical protein
MKEMMHSLLRQSGLKIASKRDSACGRATASDAWRGVDAWAAIIGQSGVGDGMRERHASVCGNREMAIGGSRAAAQSCCFFALFIHHFVPDFPLDFLWISKKLKSCWG